MVYDLFSHEIPVPFISLRLTCGLSLLPQYPQKNAFLASLALSSANVYFERDHRPSMFTNWFYLKEK